jgi:hypothetical protein
MPDNELVGVKKSEDKSETKQEAKLPKPTGWRLLVLPFKMKDKTKGGVILAEDTLERQQVASQVGLVLAMGPQCYKDILKVHGARSTIGLCLHVMQAAELRSKVGRFVC